MFSQGLRTEIAADKHTNIK